MLTKRQEERLTEDLLARLLKAKRPEDYLDQGETLDRTLADYLNELLEARKLSRGKLAKIAGMNASYVYDIFSGAKKPRRDNALMLAFALGCSLRQTQRILRLAGVDELWPKVRRDAVIIWCIDRGYTREECDDELYGLGERAIFKVTGNLR